MNVTINPEDLTPQERIKFYEWFKGKRCWFSLTENETYFDKLHVEQSRPLRKVGTVLGVTWSRLDDVDRIGLVTTEGVLHEGDFFSIEPYERFVNDGKDRYTPS